MATDFPPGKRVLRRALPRRTTYNVVCELGPAEAERTLVFIAHHDAAHSGLVFHPRLLTRLGVHWWHDLAENVDFDTVSDGIRLSEAAIRRLDERWL